MKVRSTEDQDRANAVGLGGAVGMRDTVGVGEDLPGASSKNIALETQSLQLAVVTGRLHS